MLETNLFLKSVNESIFSILNNYCKASKVVISTIYGILYILYLVNLNLVSPSQMWTNWCQLALIYCLPCHRCHGISNHHINPDWCNSAWLSSCCYNMILGHEAERSGSCLTNVSRALQNNLVKIHNARNHSYRENFKLKLCMRAQSMALGTHTKFQLEILTRSTILEYTNFNGIFWRTLETLVKHPPGSCWFISFNVFMSLQPLHLMVFSRLIGW